MLSKKVLAIVDEAGKLPAYAWPGGYQMYYMDNSGYYLCPDCANAHEEYDGVVTDYDVNYEDPLMACDSCNKWIDPSYLTEEELERARYGGDEDE